MFNDLKEKLDVFYDLPEHESARLLEEINRRARQSPDAFKSYLGSMGYGLDTERTLFYEALWDNPKGFERLFLEELEILLQRVEGDDEGAREEMDSLFYLVPIEEMSEDFHKSAYEMLQKSLLSPFAKVRQNVAEVLLEGYDEGVFRIDPPLMLKLHRLLHDPEFDVRNSVYQALDALELLPADFKLSFADRVRMKLS